MNHRFKVVIEEEPEGGYSIFAPLLPGCASQGETVKEAIANIKEAISLYLESLEADNLPIPDSDIEVIVKNIVVSV